MFRSLFLLGLALLVLPAAGLASAAPDLTLSIGIFSGQRITACAITGQAPLALQDDQGHPVAEFPAGAVLEASAEDAEVALSCSQPSGSGRAGRYTISSSQPVQVCPQGGKPRTYRGRLLLSARAGRLLLVTQVGLEDYLRGVLPSEIPSSFAPEALKAQAIAARTYAVVTAGRHRAEGFDLCDGLHCQMYLGCSGENPRTDAAVRDTAGLVVTYQGKPIHAVYHDCCGGRTAGNETVWKASDPLPYLRPVSDCDGDTPLCRGSPRSVWTREVPQAKLAAALAQFGITAPISAVERATCDENGRPKDYRIRGAQGETTLLAGVFRAAVNAALGSDTLPSADFTAAPSGDSIVFAGRGSGHGVGLCQWGANTLAQSGRTAPEILAHYYTGVSVEPISAEIAQRVARKPAG
jgi:stage II sporulation protein D